MKHFKSSDPSETGLAPPSELPMTLHIAESVENSEDLAPSELRARDLMRQRYLRILNREEND